MMRDYQACIDMGFTAGEYASAWGPDLYEQLLDSVIEYFWTENFDDCEKYEAVISVSNATEDECLDLCYCTYLETFKRYKDEGGENFEEWEINDASHEIMGLLYADLEENLKLLKENGEGKECE